MTIIDLQNHRINPADTSDESRLQRRWSRPTWNVRLKNRATGHFPPPAMAVSLETTAAASASSWSSTFRWSRFWRRDRGWRIWQRGPGRRRVSLSFRERDRCRVDVCGCQLRRSRPTIGIDLVFARVVGEGDPPLTDGEADPRRRDLDADAGEALFGGVDVGFDGVEAESVGEEGLEVRVRSTTCWTQPVAGEGLTVRVGECFQIFESAMAHASSVGEGLFGGELRSTVPRVGYESAVWRLEVRVLQAQGLRRCGRHRCSLRGWPARRLSGLGPWGVPGPTHCSRTRRRWSG